MSKALVAKQERTTKQKYRQYVGVAIRLQLNGNQQSERFPFYHPFNNLTLQAYIKHSNISITNINNTVNTFKYYFFKHKINQNEQKMTSESEEYYHPNSNSKNKRQKSTVRTNKETHKEKKEKDIHSQGYYLNQALQEAVIDIISCSELQFPEVIKENLRKINSLNVQAISYRQIVGYQLMSKMYYIEDKAKKAKLTNLTPKLTKMKATMQQKVKTGLKAFTHIKMQYEHIHAQNNSTQQSENSFKQELDGQE